MRKISKMSGVLQGNYCETYRDIPQTREMFFSGMSAATSYK